MLTNFILLVAPFTSISDNFLKVFTILEKEKTIFRTILRHLPNTKIPLNLCIKNSPDLGFTTLLEYSRRSPLIEDYPEFLRCFIYPRS